MSPLVEKLLQPIPGDSPCGPDLSSDPRFDEIENLLKGKPEVDIGTVVRPAEPPEWPQLKKECVEFLGVSKHLRVAVVLCCSLLKVDGLAGFRDGMQILRGLLENFWDSVHPLLDPDDNNDPLMRLNNIGVITAPRSSYSLGWLQIIDSLYAAPLCKPRGAAPVTLDALLAAAAQKEAGPDAPAPSGPDAATLATQMRSVNPADLEAIRTAVTEAAEALAGIDAFLSNTLGASGTISFEDLQSTLAQLEHHLTSNMAGGAEAPSEAAASESGYAAAGDETGGVAAGPGVAVGADVIRNRGDVVRILEKICDYYRHVEPGSPVPYLLVRAQKLATMSFVEAVQELNIATPETLRPSMGSAIEGGAPVPPAES